MILHETKKQALKHNAIFFFIFLALSSVCIVLGIVLPGDWTYALLAFGVLWFGYSFYYLINGILRINRSYCPECSTGYDYENYDVTWHEISQSVENDKVISTIKFECVCPKCGNKVTFHKTFRRGTYSQDQEKWKEHDIYALAKKIFWNDNFIDD